MAETRTVEELARDEFVAEADLIARLVGTPGWETYERLIDGMRNAALEEMATARADDIRMWQGAVATLREVLDRPHQIIEGARAVLDEEADDEQRLLSIKRSLEMTDIHADDI